MRKALENLMQKIVFGLILTMLLTACSHWPPRPVPAAIVKALAPSGELRVAINLGNPILAQKGEKDDAPIGVSVDISRELALRLGVPLKLVTLGAAGQAVEGLKRGVVDLIFVAIDPVRSTDILYSAAYLMIEGSYLVPQASAIKRNDEVDRVGVRVVVGDASAYDLYLSRALISASLVRALTSPAVSDLLLSGGYEVAAGVRQQLQADARRLPGLRLLDGRFMEINQAVGIPLGRQAGLGFLRGFVEELKATGFVSRALERHGIQGATVAATAP
jgi:polar amino acid transport system substrate-binding protein